MSKTKATTFSICLVSRETPDIVKRFLTYHVSLGAEEIFLFHDGPSADLWDHGLQLDEETSARCRIIGTEDEVWPKEVKRNPRTFIPRQEALFNHAYALCQSNWLICIDADEFLFGSRNIGEVLGAISPDVSSVTIENVEAVWGPGESLGKSFSSTYFRRQMPPSPDRADRLRKAHGPTPRLLNAEGFVGHTLGKSAHRVTAGLDHIAVHWGENDATNISRPFGQVIDDPDALLLAHFDAVSFQRWRDKFDHRKRMNLGDRRRKILARVSNMAMRFGYGPRLFRMLYGLNARQIELLGPDVVFRRDLFSGLEVPDRGCGRVRHHVKSVSRD